MDKFKASELVLNEDGSVYHLRLHSHQLADNVIVVGDPGRVCMVSEFFDEIQYKVENREIITHTGHIKGVPITVMSTGMGTDNIDICMNELHVLAAYDLQKKEILEKPRTLNIIRIGTSGALQKTVEVGSVVVSKYAIGIDGLLNFYGGDKSCLSDDLALKFEVFTNWPQELAKPYAAKASSKLLKLFDNPNYNVGITLTAPGFYGPQFRHLFLEPINPNLKDSIVEFSYDNLKILNFEMETSALYGLGRMLQHNMLTLCLIIANRLRGDFISNYKPLMKQLVENVLYVLVNKINEK